MRADQLKQFRISEGLTIDAMSQEIGMSREEIEALERGQDKVPAYLLPGLYRLASERGSRFFFKERLVFLRHRTKISQMAMAPLFGVNYATLGNWETGHHNPAAQHFTKLCELEQMEEDALTKKTEVLKGSTASVLQSKIKEFKEKHKLSIVELGILGDVSPTTVKRWLYQPSTSQSMRSQYRLNNLLAMKAHEVATTLAARKTNDLKEMTEATKELLPEVNEALQEVESPEQGTRDRAQKPEEGEVFFRKSHRPGPAYLQELRTALGLSEPQMASLLHIKSATKIRGYESRSLNIPFEVRDRLVVLGKWVQRTNPDTSFEKLSHQAHKEMAHRYGVQEFSDDVPPISPAPPAPSRTSELLNYKDLKPFERSAGYHMRNSHSNVPPVVYVLFGVVCTIAGACGAMLLSTFY